MAKNGTQSGAQTNKRNNTLVSPIPSIALPCVEFTTYCTRHNASRSA